MEKFSERETTCRGVSEVRISDSSASYYFAAFTSSGLRRSAPMILVDGELALAECVMKNIRGGRAYGKRWAGVRFGPGGRRRYCWVTESLIEEILDAANWGGPNWRKNSKEEKRNGQIADFAMDLLEAIS